MANPPQLPPEDDGRNPGSEPLPSVAVNPVKEPARIPAVGNGVTPPLPSVPIGKPGYEFKHAVNTREGQAERREHDRIRKNERRAAHKASEPPPLASVPLVDPLQAPGGEQGPGGPVTTGPVVVEPFVPWVADDVCDFTDEIVELAELRRVSQFVEIAREAKLPGKVIAQIEKDSHYPSKSKANLKRCLGDVVAKALNKTGVSAKNKEEVKLLFVAVTIKLQGMRMLKDLRAMIAADQAQRAASEPAKKPNADSPQLSIVQ